MEVSVGRAKIKAGPPSIIYSPRWDSGICEVCRKEITNSSRRALLVNEKGRGGFIRYVYAYQICIVCEKINSGMLEAEDEQRRFTKVCVGQYGSGIGEYMGPRCLCGAAAIYELCMCVQCWRSQRMLKRAQSEINIIRKMTTQINRQIKEQKNATQ